MGIAVVVIANDFSAINVALPTMEKDFDTNVNTIQWVVNAYALTFGVMIVAGGRLADMFGRRNAFFLGSAIFASKRRPAWPEGSSSAPPASATRSAR
jgi:MFS family permease